MLNAQAFLYLLGVVLLVLAAFGAPRDSRISLAALGAASLALGYALPAIAHLFAG